MPIRSGAYSAFFGGFGPQFDGISQTARGLLNQPLLKGRYKFSFQLAVNGNPQLPAGNEAFQVQWNGRTVYSSANKSQAIGGYQELEFTETTRSSSSTVLFQGYKSFSTITYLDDVSLTLVGV